MLLTKSKLKKEKERGGMGHINILSLSKDTAFIGMSTVEKIFLSTFPQRPMC